MLARASGSGLTCETMTTRLKGARVARRRSERCCRATNGSELMSAVIASRIPRDRHRRSFASAGPAERRREG